MPVNVHSYVHFNTPPGSPPAAPAAVTSITKDAGATVSFRAPSDVGTGPVTQWIVTPYIAGAAQAATTVNAASAGSITGSDGSTYVQVPVSGLTNATAYTFTARARNAYGDSPESAASGANTPLAGLVFGDDFNGTILDPEWWVYTRCGFLAQNEVQYYLPSQVQLDGAGNLLLIADHAGYTGPTYPSDGNRTVTQPWRSGAVQSNTRTYTPASGNTMTFESKFQVCPDAGGAMWPGLFWLEGQDYIQAWKTDPAQSGWNTTGKAEIDVAEWFSVPVTNYLVDVLVTGWAGQTITTSTDFSAAPHVFSAAWKPGVSVKFYRDSILTYTYSSGVPAAGCQMFLLLYLQIVAGSAASPQHCTIDYVRVFDQNLG